jgi:hypothetical protein
MGAGVVAATVAGDGADAAVGGCDDATAVPATAPVGGTAGAAAPPAATPSGAAAGTAAAAAALVADGDNAFAGGLTALDDDDLPPPSLPLLLALPDPDDDFFLPSVTRATHTTVTRRQLQRTTEQNVQPTLRHGKSLIAGSADSLPFSTARTIWRALHASR